MPTLEVASVVREFEWNDFYDRLRDFGAQFIDDATAQTQSSRTPDTHIVLKRVMPEDLPVFVKQEMGHLAVQHLQIFWIKARSCGMIHTDGLDRHCALNIPLRNTDLGIQEWFEHPFTEYAFRGNGTVSRVTTEEVHQYPLKWDKPASLQLVLKKPTVVNTNMWHRVDNRNNPNHRYVISLRFKDNPSFEHVVRCLTPVEDLPYESPTA